MNARSREVFKKIVDAYVATGEPIGSRTLSKQLSTSFAAIDRTPSIVFDIFLPYSSLLNLALACYWWNKAETDSFIEDEFSQTEPVDKANRQSA